MRKFVGKAIKATIISVIVAFFITMGIIGCIHLFLGAEIEETISMINKISVNIQNKEIKEIVINEENRIENYPEYGTKYATLEIPKINVNLPIYYGDTLEVLTKGVGHSSGSYFPGEGGSIIYMGHRSSNVLRRLNELEPGDEIMVKANYGEYKYRIYDKKIIKETEVDQVPVQDEKEILMIYTCHPINTIGHAKKRCVVYAELEK